MRIPRVTNGTAEYGLSSTWVSASAALGTLPFDESADMGTSCGKNTSVRLIFLAHFGGT